MVREIPLSQFAEWPKPNLVDPVTRGYSLMIVTIVFLTINVAAVSLRLYTRHFMRHWLGWDDLWSVVGLFFAITFGIAALLDMYTFLGFRHVYDIPFATFKHTLQTAAACKCLFTLAGMAIRQSLLCFYLRLLGDAGIKWFKWVIYTAITINILCGTIFGFLSIIQCSPVKAYWLYPSVAFGTCLSEIKVTLSTSIIIVVVDFCTVLLPIPMILRLKMTLRSKIGVCFLLSMGVLATTAAMVRCYYVWKALAGSYDVSWYVYPLWLCCTVEINVALFCSCVPATRPWFRAHSAWLQRSLSWVSRFRTSGSTPKEKESDTTTGTTRAQGLSKEGMGSDAPLHSKMASALQHSEKTGYDEEEALPEKETPKANNAKKQTQSNFLLSATNMDGTNVSSEEGYIDVASTHYSPGPQSLLDMPGTAANSLRGFYAPDDESSPMSRSQIRNSVRQAVRRGTSLDGNRSEIVRVLPGLHPRVGQRSHHLGQQPPEAVVHEPPAVHVQAELLDVENRALDGPTPNNSASGTDSDEPPQRVKHKQSASWASHRAAAYAAQTGGKLMKSLERTLTKPLWEGTPKYGGSGPQSWDEHSRHKSTKRRPEPTHIGIGSIVDIERRSRDFARTTPSGESGGAALNRQRPEGSVGWPAAPPSEHNTSSDLGYRLQQSDARLQPEGRDTWLRRGRRSPSPALSAEARSVTALPMLPAHRAARSQARNRDDHIAAPETQARNHPDATDRPSSTSLRPLAPSSLRLTQPGSRSLPITGTASTDGSSTTTGSSAGDQTFFLDTSEPGDLH